MAGAGLLLAVSVLVLQAEAGQARLRLAFESLNADDPRDAGPALEEADRTGLVGRIVADRVGLDVMVGEGTTAPELLIGAGHVPRSALPGEPGNIVLAGHRDTYFRPLKDLRCGDRIEVQTAGRAFRYTVDSVLVVRPDSVELMERGTSDRLTLITCFPFHWIGPAPLRYVVLARPLPSVHNGASLGS